MNLKQVFSFLIVFQLSTFALSADLPKFGEVSDSEWALAAIPDYPDANAAVIFDKGVLEVSLEGISFYHHIRKKVFNEAGAEEAGDVVFFYYDDDKIKDLKAQTITPDGKKHEVKKSDIKEQKIGDLKSRTFSFPQIEPGSIIEYTYRNFNKRFGTIDPWYFHNDFFTINSEFNLKLHPGFVYSTAYNNVPPIKQQSEEEYDIGTKIKTFTWQMQNLPPLKDEPYQGALKNFRSALHCQMVSYDDNWSSYTFISDWPDLGKFFQEKVIEPYVRSGKELIPLVERLTTGMNSTEDAAIAIFEFVRDSIKIRPNDGEYFTSERIGNLIEGRVGSSDEKNLLVVEMCKRAGMNAWPALISTRSHGIFNYSIYQLNQLNQLISVVETDQGGIILDATSQYCPYGILSPDCLVKGGLLIDGERSRPITINPMPPKSIRIDKTIVQLNDSGAVRCSTHIALNGYLTVDYGEQYEKTEPEKFAKDVLLGAVGDDCKLISHKFEIAPKEQKMEAFLVYEPHDFAEILDGNLFIDQPIYKFRSNPFVEDKRFFPIDFNYPAVYNNVIVYELDSSFTITELPENKEVSSSMLDFTRTCFVNDNKLTIDSKFSIGEALISPEMYMGVRRVFTELERANSEQVVFVPAEK